MQASLSRPLYVWVSDAPRRLHLIHSSSSGANLTSALKPLAGSAKKRVFSLLRGAEAWSERPIATTLHP